MPAPSTGPRSGHTPGPWAVRDGDLLRVHGTANNTTVCGVHRIGRHGGKVVGDALANARLIAAAPALLEAAKRLKAIHDDLSARIDQGEDTDDAFDLWDEGVTELGAAIALAEGRP